MAINADGTKYNGGQGWKTNARLNSSGAESTSNATGLEVTGFMPVTENDTVYFKNIVWADTGCYFAWYTADFTCIKSESVTALPKNYGAVYSDAGQLGSLEMSQLNKYYGVSGEIKWFRISAEEITSGSIITVNQPVE